MKTGPNMRTITDSRCELDFSGTRYQCRLDDISSTGARLNCLGFLHEINRGDKVVLHLQTDTSNISCRIADIAAAKINLRFVG